MPREVKVRKKKIIRLGKGLGNLMKVDTVESVFCLKGDSRTKFSELVPNADQPRKKF